MSYKAITAVRGTQRASLIKYNRVSARFELVSVRKSAVFLTLVVFLIIMKCPICRGTGKIVFTHIKIPLKPVEQTTACFKCLGYGQQLRSEIEDATRFSMLIDIGVRERLHEQL